MTHHLYPVIANRARKPHKGIPSGASLIEVPLDTHRRESAVGTNTWRVLDGYRLSPTRTAVELYRLAVLVYTADLRLGRGKTRDAWTRDIVIHLPVSDLSKWRQATPAIDALLTFLSGDRWIIHPFREEIRRPRRDERAWGSGVKLDAPTVSLFSGGLDSLVGSLDLLAGGESVALVGHYESGWTKRTQGILHSRLAVEYPGAAHLVQFMIQPSTTLTGEVEPSTRSRSFLFISLGALVCSALGSDTRLVVPENGFIALNAPSTPTRLGALSTRTAHPHTIALFRKALLSLEIPLNLVTPYDGFTKGEMLAKSSARRLLRTIARQSMSCGHPNAGRWRKQAAYAHCGYCVPCIIRRAAMSALGWDRSMDYRVDLMTATARDRNLDDVRALLSALARSSDARAATDVLRSGPLSDDPSRIADYIAVYKRGLEELRGFLDRRATRRL